jgi:hypothetical protein
LHLIAEEQEGGGLQVRSNSDLVFSLTLYPRNGANYEVDNKGVPMGTMVMELILTIATIGVGHDS